VFAKDMKEIKKTLRKGEDH